MKPYFKELAIVKPNNTLYSLWIKYILSLENSDIVKIIEMGLTHQAYALKSMINELVANENAPQILVNKIDAVISATNNKADKIRNI